MVEAAAWQTYTLQQIDVAVNSALEANKYLFIWDKQGSAATFLQYRGANVESIAAPWLSKHLGRKTAADVAEIVRKAFVMAMRGGKQMCLDLEKSKPIWSELNTEGTFDVDDFFDWQKMNTAEVYQQYVRDDEKHQESGDNSTYGYSRSQDFVGILRTSVNSEDEVNQVIAEIPNFEQNFIKAIIE